MTRMDDTDYDTMSTSSTATSSDFTFIIQDMEDERQDNTSSSYDAFIESLYEKRSAKIKLMFLSYESLFSLKIFSLLL